jgi:hypothetical protein
MRIILRLIAGCNASVKIAHAAKQHLRIIILTAVENVESTEKRSLCIFDETVPLKLFSSMK